MYSDYQRRQLRDEYTARINRVIDFIENNLDEDLSLKRLSAVANFSEYHFHRIFKSMTGETLNGFVNRIRLEKSASFLTGNPAKTITEIAYDCGFSGSAAFSRSFRELFGVTPSQWRKAGSRICKNKSSNCIKQSNAGKDLYEMTFYIDEVTKNQVWRISMINKNDVKIEVKELEGFELAYVRHIGPYKGDESLFKSLFERLYKWAGPRGLLNFPETKVLCVYHDDPGLTDDEKLRTSACITVPADTRSEGEVGRMKIEAGRYAVASFEIQVDEYEDAWNIVCAEWLPESGYQPADGPCFEICLNDPDEHPENRHLIEICIPVKPL